MSPKFSVNLLKSLPKLRPVLRSQPALNYSVPSREHENHEKDWKLELAGPCDTDQIVSFVEDQFLKEEPLYKALIPGQKPLVLNRYFRKKLDHGLTIVARNCCNPQEIVGVSINERSGKLDGVKLCKMSKENNDPNLRKLFEVFAIINLEPKINETLCQDEIFNIAALSVSEHHYGKGIGLGLVERSLELACENRFDYAKLNCTSDNIRKIAEQLKMQKFWSASYKDILCRGSKPPRALPESPHCEATVFYMDLNKMPKKNC